MTESAMEHLKSGDVFILHKSELDLIGESVGNDVQNIEVKAFGNFVVIRQSNS
jgi:hypothetical protein